jgi:hypothetical protein
MELQSTSLKAAEYQPRNALLEVEFRTGAVYRYFEVPASIYQELLEAESKGRYFNQHIRNRFRTEKIDPASSRLI